MLHEVDEAIETLVRRHVLDGADVDVAFEAPTREWSAKRQRPALNLFLYDLREDLDRRVVPAQEVRDESGRVVERSAPPRFYKLSYLVTAWTKRPEDEHRVLGLVLAAFLQYEVLPAEVLTGTLTDYARHVRVQIGLPPPQDRSLSDVWSALGGELKPSLDLVISAPLDPQRYLEVGPPVTAGLALTGVATSAPAAEVRDAGVNATGVWAVETMPLASNLEGGVRRIEEEVS